MKKNVLTVLLQPADGGEPVEEAVTVMLGDQMRAELELAKRKQSPSDHGINFLSAMAWIALAREGRTTLRFEEFAAQTYDIERVKDDAAGDVDPTQPAASPDSA